MSSVAGNLPLELPKTAFAALPRQFPDVQTRIRTNDFLEAAAGAVLLVEKFGRIFSPVVYDMNGNIKKITIKYEEDVEGHQYLDNMILKAKQERQPTSVDALQWLRRGLHFLTRFFELVIDDNGCNHDLNPFMKIAYGETLQPYHGWMTSQLFKILSQFSPNRQHLLYTLGMENHNREGLVLHDMRMFTQKMSACVAKLSQFYEEHNLETNYKV